MDGVASSKAKVAALSVASNFTLVVLKVIIGLFTGSVSVISEAIHSGIDLLAAVIALVAVRTSHKPADPEHPFGHGKIENISGFVEAILIFLAAGWIIYEAIQKMISPTPLESLGWGIAVMCFSSLVNIFVSGMLFRVGKKTNSMALQADAWHLRVDVWTSAGVMAGLGLIWVAEKIWANTNFQWIDPVAAIAVAFLIFRAAYDLTHQALQDLMDRSLTDAEKKQIQDAILAYSKQICGFHRLRTRKAGANQFVEFHLLVDGGMTVEASHDLANAITEKINQMNPHAAVTIHIEPCNGYCSEVCRKGCLLPAREREKRHLMHYQKAEAAKQLRKQK